MAAPGRWLKGTCVFLLVHAGGHRPARRTATHCRARAVRHRHRPVPLASERCEGDRLMAAGIPCGLGMRAPSAVRRWTARTGTRRCLLAWTDREARAHLPDDKCGGRRTLIRWPPLTGKRTASPAAGAPVVSSPTEPWVTNSSTTGATKPSAPRPGPGDRDGTTRRPFPDSLTTAAGRGLRLRVP